MTFTVKSVLSHDQQFSSLLRKAADHFVKIFHGKRVQVTVCLGFNASNSPLVLLKNTKSTVSIVTAVFGDLMKCTLRACITVQASGDGRR